MAISIADDVNATMVVLHSPLDDPAEKPINLQTARHSVQERR